MLFGIVEHSLDRAQAMSTWVSVALYFFAISWIVGCSVRRGLSFTMTYFCSVQREMIVTTYCYDQAGCKRWYECPCSYRTESSHLAGSEDEFRSGWQPRACVNVRLDPERVRRNLQGPLPLRQWCLWGIRPWSSILQWREPNAVMSSGVQVKSLF